VQIPCFSKSYAESEKWSTIVAPRLFGGPSNRGPSTRSRQGVTARSRLGLTVRPALDLAAKPLLTTASPFAID
jgi:hypothetical protein